MSILYFGITAFVFYICAKDSTLALTETIYKDIKKLALPSVRRLQTKSKIIMQN